MVSRVLVHQTFGTLPVLLSVELEWVQPGVRFEARPGLNASQVGLEDFALLPSVESARLVATHLILPEVAVTATNTGAIAMHTPVRPDEVETSPVRLFHVSSTAEFLARATLREFYGITPSAWQTEASATAGVVVLEGVDALAEPEAGFSEDLVRAWFILTGRAVVTHVLLAPLGATESERQAVVASFREVLSVSSERRRDLRAVITEQAGLTRERVTAALLSQRYSMTPGDLQSLIWLIRRGAPGTNITPVDSLPILWPADG